MIPPFFFAGFHLTEPFGLLLIPLRTIDRGETMLWLLACLGKNSGEFDSAEESQNVVELGGSSRAIDVCQPREQHQLTIGLVAKECP
jgi:hypothetical protein